jgi:prevent-host-death family protein
MSSLTLARAGGLGLAAGHRSTVCSMMRRGLAGWVGGFVLPPPSGTASVIMAIPRLSLPARVAARCYGRSHDLPADRGPGKAGRTVAEARRSHRPVTISEHGKPVAALINVDDLADLEDRAALAAHLADKAAGRGGISLEELDAALDRIDAETLS